MARYRLADRRRSWLSQAGKPGAVDPAADRGLLGRAEHETHLSGSGMAQPPISVITIGRILPAIFASGLMLLVLAMLWAPITRQMVHGAPLNDLAKDYYLYDASSYMTIVRNVADGGGLSVEPFTGTGSSIYPSAHMWFVGNVARAFGLTPFGAWTVTAFLVGVVLFVAFGVWGRSMTGSPWGWLCGSVPVLIGILPWAGMHSWAVTFSGHGHAVLWPAFAILYAGGPETTALLLAFVGIVLVQRSLLGLPSRCWLLAATGGLLCGLALNVQTYVAMLATTIGAVLMALDAIRRGTRPRAFVVAGMIAAATGLGVAMVPASIPVLRLGLVLIGLLGASALGGLRTGWWRASVGFSIGAALGAAPELLSILGAVRRSDEFLPLRQQTHLNVSLPPLSVVWYCLPTLVLAAGALSCWRRRNGKRPAERSTIIAIALAGTFLVFNERWGFNQEPYRFLPYTMLLLGVLSLPWLLSPLFNRTDLVARVITVSLLILTTPSAVAFVKDNQAVARLGAYQSGVFNAIGKHAPKRELVLLDPCTPAAIFKIATGISVAAFNRGMAFPAHRQEIEAVIRAQERGVTPTLAEFRAAGIGLVVVEEGCHVGPSASQYEGQLGTALGSLHASGPMIENSDPRGHFPLKTRTRLYRFFVVPRA